MWVAFEPRLPEANKEEGAVSVKAWRQKPLFEEEEEARWLEHSKQGGGQRSMGQRCEGS